MEKEYETEDRKYVGSTTRQIANIGMRDVQEKIELYLYRQIKQLPKKYKEVVVVFVGTDRSTGDSLGPLAGTKLAKRGGYGQKIKVYGTLHDPVHAQNLEDKLNLINHDESLVIGVDSSLGRKNNVGNIAVTTGQLNPGSGVGKTLRAFGDITITGVVNMSGYMEFQVLQNTRLALVYEMAEVIEKAIHSVMCWVEAEQEINEKNEKINATLRQEIAQYGGVIIEGELKVEEILERKLKKERMVEGESRGIL